MTISEKQTCLSNVPVLSLVKLKNIQSIKRQHYKKITLKTPFKNLYKTRGFKKPSYDNILKVPIIHCSSPSGGKLKNSQFIRSQHKRRQQQQKIVKI